LIVPSGLRPNTAPFSLGGASTVAGGALGLGIGLVTVLLWPVSVPVPT
jgi:hypothetical protein